VTRPSAPGRAESDDTDFSMFLADDEPMTILALVVRRRFSAVPYPKPFDPPMMTTVWFSRVFTIAKYYLKLIVIVKWKCCCSLWMVKMEDSGENLYFACHGVCRCGDRTFVAFLMYHQVVVSVGVIGVTAPPRHDCLYHFASGGREGVYSSIFLSWPDLRLCRTISVADISSTPN